MFAPNVKAWPLPSSSLVSRVQYGRSIKGEEYDLNLLNTFTDRTWRETLVGLSSATINIWSTVTLSNTFEMPTCQVSESLSKYLSDTSLRLNKMVSQRNDLDRYFQYNPIPMWNYFLEANIELLEREWEGMQLTDRQIRERGWFIGPALA